MNYPEPLDMHDLTRDPAPPMWDGWKTVAADAAIHLTVKCHLAGQLFADAIGSVVGKARLLQSVAAQFAEEAARAAEALFESEYGHLTVPPPRVPEVETSGSPPEPEECLACQ